ncbi:MAG: molecular chaperone DnaJ [Chloroflexi bacterium]|nr:molecular chaperone DnaJ [Chloroflexota bacterium]
MANKRDYYEVLGVPRDATEESVRKAFRRLALEYHPDRNTDAGAEDRFKEINEAYQVLSNPDRRAAYDRHGHAGVAVANGGWQGFEGIDTLGGLGDIFDAFFGGMGAGTQARPRRGRDLQLGLTISFEEAALGTQRRVEVTRTEPCGRCRGSRSEPGTSPERCRTCQGNGQVRRSQRSLFGQFVQVVSCPACRGEGQTVTHPCAQCRGRGLEPRTRQLEVNIPAGVEDGTRIRLTGEGEAGVPGARPGDLYIDLRVQEHAFFRRQDNDLLYELAVNFAQAALGDTVKVPTLQGEEALRIPAGIQSGTVLRIRGKGVPHLDGGRRGDLLVTVTVVTPKDLDPEARRLLEALAKKLGAPDGAEERRRPPGWFRGGKGRSS